MSVVIDTSGNGGEANINVEQFWKRNDNCVCKLRQLVSLTIGAHCKLVTLQVNAYPLVWCRLREDSLAYLFLVCECLHLCNTYWRRCVVHFENFPHLIPVLVKEGLHDAFRLAMLHAPEHMLEYKALCQWNAAQLSIIRRHDEQLREIQAEARAKALEADREAQRLSSANRKWLSQRCRMRNVDALYSSTLECHVRPSFNCNVGGKWDARKALDFRSFVKHAVVGVAIGLVPAVGSAHELSLLVDQCCIIARESLGNYAFERACISVYRAYYTNLRAAAEVHV